MFNHKSSSLAFEFHVTVLVCMELNLRVEAMVNIRLIHVRYSCQLNILVLHCFAGISFNFCNEPLCKLNEVISGRRIYNFKS